MKKILVYLFALSALFTTGCTKAFDNIADAHEVESISLTFNLTIDIENLTGYNMTLKVITMKIWNTNSLLIQLLYPERLVMWLQ